MTSTDSTRPTLKVVRPAKRDMCPLHKAFEKDYCPTCGTAQDISRTPFQGR